MKRIAGTGLLCYRALRSSNRRTEAACRKAGGHVQRSDRQKHPILRGWKHKRNRHLWIATAYVSAASTGRASRPPIRQAELKRGDLKSSALPHMGHLLITSFSAAKFVHIYYRDGSSRRDYFSAGVFHLFHFRLPHRQIPAPPYPGKTPPVLAKPLSTLYNGRNFADRETWRDICFPVRQQPVDLREKGDLL